MFVLAQLDPSQLSVVQRFEQAAGVRLLAMKDMEVASAPITADMLEELQQLEEELGVCLVAVR